MKLHKSSKFLQLKINYWNWKSFSTITTTRFFQLLTNHNTGENLHYYLSANKNHCSNVVKIGFRLMHETMISYNLTPDSLYGATKLAIPHNLRPEGDVLSNCSGNFKKTVSFDDKLYFIDEVNIMIYVGSDSAFTFSPIFQNMTRCKISPPKFEFFTKQKNANLTLIVRSK